MKASYAAVEAKADALEAEMKRIGLWQSNPLAPENTIFSKPLR